MSTILKKYVIQGLGEFFDGLVAHCEEFPLMEANLILVNRIEQPSQLFDTFSLPVAGGMYIHSSRLAPYIEPGEEQLTDNPFGAYRSEGKIERDGVSILWGLYSRALTINIKNGGKTMFSRNVFDKEIVHNVKAYLDSSSIDEHWDIHIALFDLQEICNG